jgi:hypothetical protein
MADLVSVTEYEIYHFDIESMGFGLYGGSYYDQGYRNRDGWAGSGTLGNQEARLYIQDEFTAMGLTVSVQGSYLNVVGELTGTTTPEKVYIIGGHYDHVGGDRPGGDDNASGTAGVLEAARVMSGYPVRIDYTFHRLQCRRRRPQGKLGLRQRSYDDRKGQHEGYAQSGHDLAPWLGL